MHPRRDKEGERERVMYRPCQKTDVGLVGVVFIRSLSIPEPFSLMTKANSPRRKQFYHLPPKPGSRVYFLFINRTRFSYTIFVSHLTIYISFFYLHFNVFNVDLPWHSISICPVLLLQNKGVETHWAGHGLSFSF